MKKNSKLIICVFIIIVVIFIILFMPINNKDIIMKKANFLFGESKICSITEIMTCDLTKRKCIICNKKFIGSSSQIICVDCCDITNRCCVCGELKK